MSTGVTLYYVHDPMCSWCWGFAPVLAELESRLPAELPVRRLLGGLAPDTDEPMPEAMRGYIQDAWRQIQRRIPGTEFNFEFWQRCRPRRATYLACRAVIAARRQGAQYDRAMTRAIQVAYYTRALNPSEDETLIGLAAELGLDVARFARDLNSEEVGRELEAEIALARSLDVESFPSLVLETRTGPHPIAVDYRDSSPMLERILKLWETARQRDA
ncbi:DsbA family protein [Thioalkalivibrio sulfidiphilus]|uniref:DsbA family protein n=1 Tax=Thioalkalivibrio sulfidiphilus TaxID=1033854 RepID=UPI003B363B8A